MLLLLLLNLFWNYSGAQAQEKSAFESTLERDTAMKSQESWVEIKGQRYRRFEFEGARYYVRFSDPTAKVADLFCTPPAGFQNERLVIAQPEVVPRSRAFVQVFHENCKETHGTSATVLHLDPAIGLVYPETKSASKKPSSSAP